MLTNQLASLMKQRTYDTVLDLVSTIPGKGIDFSTLKPADNSAPSIYL